MPAMNHSVPDCMEVELLFAAMDSDPGDDESILFVWEQMEPVQKKALIVTLRQLMAVIEPLEPKTWQGIGKHRGHLQSKTTKTESGLPKGRGFNPIYRQ